MSTKVQSSASETVLQMLSNAAVIESPKAGQLTKLLSYAAQSNVEQNSTRTDQKISV